MFPPSAWLVAKQLLGEFHHRVPLTGAVLGHFHPGALLDHQPPLPHVNNTGALPCPEVLSEKDQACHQLL